MTRQLIGAEEVAEITGMSKSFSFKLIKTLNAELAAQGIMTIPGKVQRSYFAVSYTHLTLPTILRV